MHKLCFYVLIVSITSFVQYNTINGGCFLKKKKCPVSTCECFQPKLMYLC